MPVKVSSASISIAMITVALAAAAPATGGNAQAVTGPPAAIRVGSHVNWPTYHANARRTGSVAGLPTAGQLAVGWSRRLKGAVYGQPLVIGTTVIAATERDRVYGLRLTTGRVRWSVHVASALPLASQPCGNINPLGITSTPTYYRGLVYVLAQDGRTRHMLIGIDPASGRVRYRRSVPSPDHRRFYDQQRAALAAGNGLIYIAFAGHFGDCGPYVGSVVGVPAAGPHARSKPVLSYRVPSSDHAGIWAAGGPVIGGKGTVFVGVGNGDTSPPFDYSDSVTALSPRLHRTGVFAPASWVQDNRNDLDLGSLTPALTKAGLMLTVGKRGVGYLLRSRHLGGIGGQIAKLGICAAFGGAAVKYTTVIVPCDAGGPAAVSTRNGRLRVLWRGPPSADGSPVIGGAAVWVTDTSAGVLYELNATTGAIRHLIRLGSPLAHFASPTLAGRVVLIGTLHGVVAVTGA
ncbi:MAG: outer membrane protein assembly factor BamB family protein [Streptosporangiaceae bacterium]